MSTQAQATLTRRPSEQRGWGSHGWLESYHSFSFAGYFDPKWMSHGPLRVLNEDRVEPDGGFPTHPHREANIFSYVVDGVIGHKDSMGNIENLRRGDVQMTFGGTGIAHSEYNGSKTGQDLHFLQIWATPSKRGLKPRYYTRHYTDEEKTNKLLPIVAPEGTDGATDEREGAKGPTPIASDLTCFASILTPGSTVSYTYPTNAPRKGYLHLIMRKTGYRTPREQVKAGGPTLAVSLDDGQHVSLVEGDAAVLDKVQGRTVTVKNSGEADAEFVFFDVGDQA